MPKSRYILPCFHELAKLPRSTTSNTLIPGHTTALERIWIKSKQRYGWERLPGREMGWSLTAGAKKQQGNQRRMPCFAVKVNEAEYEEFVKANELVGETEFIPAAVNQEGHWQQKDEDALQVTYHYQSRRGECQEELGATANWIAYAHGKDPEKQSNYENYVKPIVELMHDHKMQDEELFRIDEQVQKIRKEKLPFVSSVFKKHEQMLLNILNNNRQVGNYLGIQLLHLEKDLVVGKLPVHLDLAQPMGILHGGVSVVLAESLASIGSLLNCDMEKNVAVGQEINCNHISSLRVGKGHTLVGLARPIHRGRSSQVWNVELVDEKTGKLVAWSRMTAAIVPRPKM